MKINIYRIIGFFITVILLPPVALSAFPDVTSTDPNIDAILYIQTNKIVEGYPDGTFRPYQTINRAEFIKIITIAVNGKLPNQKAYACFKDIRGNEWYAASVCWAHDSNAIGGYPDGTFKPENNINFAEAAKIIVNIFNPNTARVSGDNEPWYKVYIEYLDAQNAIPVSIKTFDQNITRGEMAEIIYRLQTKEINKPSRAYNEFIESTKWTSYINKELGISFDCPIIICSTMKIYMGDNNTWSIRQIHDCPTCEKDQAISSHILSELTTEESKQQMQIINNNTILENKSISQGGNKIIFETSDISGTVRSAIATCGNRMLLFPEVHLELENAKEEWNIIQHILESLQFTRC